MNMTYIECIETLKLLGLVAIALALVGIGFNIGGQMSLGRNGLTQNKKKFRYAKEHANKINNNVCRVKNCNNKVGKNHHKFCDDCHTKMFGY